MNTKIFVPELIKVGFNARQDTYTKKLGYVIYHDGKVWRKEGSWESWRTKVVSSEEIEVKKQEQYNNQWSYYKNNYDSMINYLKENPSYEYYKKQLEGISNAEEYAMKMVGSYENYKYQSHNETEDVSLAPVEYDNIPTEGFVLNKKAGGGRGWDARQTVCRIYDPRGFEFEITLDNLLYILENTTSTVGKGLEGKFVYGWSGKDLVLLPENAPEYEEIMKFTEIKNMVPVKKSELKPGGIYLNSQNEKVVYIDNLQTYNNHGFKVSKELVFCNVDGSYIRSCNIKTIKKYIDEDVTNYADIHAKVISKEPYKTPTVVKSFVKYKEQELHDLMSKHRGYSHATHSVYVLKGKRYVEYYLRKDYYSREYGVYKRKYGHNSILPKHTSSAKEILNQIELYKIV